MIVLFNDSPHYPNRSVGVYRIATALRRHGLEVEVIDFMLAWEKDGVEQFFQYLDKITSVEWWGFSGKFPMPGARKMNPLTNTMIQTDSLFTFASVEFEERLLKYIKDRSGTIVVGGPNAYALRNIIDPHTVDILCDGYADVGVIAIHEHIVNGSELKYTVENTFKIVDCDKDYHDIDLSSIDVEYHETDFVDKGEVFPIEISRGCIFKCAYCTYSHIGKKAGTYIRTKESIAKDIVDRYSKYNSTRFVFVDDTFNDSVEKMELIAEIRQRTGIPFEFWSYGRLDLLRAQPRMLELMEETGWASITFGVETFNRSSGKAIGKGADPEKLKEFLLEFRERYPEISVRVNIIVGLPDDTETSAEETVQWFLDHPDVADHVSVKSLRIYEQGGRKSVGKIGDAPGDYGYSILEESVRENTVSQTINWVNKNQMTQQQAKLIARRLQKKINTEFKMDEQKLLTVHSMGKGSLSIGEEGNLNDVDRYRVIRYLHRKKKYRGVI